MKLPKGILTTLMLFVTSLLLAVTTLSAAEGADTYKSKCSMCHGADGKGFSAIHTPDFTDPKVQASISDKQMEEIIKNGKKGTAMPAFSGKLKDEEIQDVIKYIRSLNSEKK